MLKKLFFAFQGLKAAFKTEQSFRIQLIIAILVIVLGLVIGISVIEWLFIIISIGTVLAFELLNSMIEKILDILHPEARERVKIIKDISAAAVLLVAFMAICVGFIIFTPYIIDIIN